MKRKTVKTIALIIIIAMVITSFTFLLYLPGSAYGAVSAYGDTTPQEQMFLNQKLKELENFLKLIKENYKDKVEYKTLVDGAFDGAMNSLGDPYSTLFSDTEEGQSYYESATGEYSGIGVTIVRNAGGICEVTFVIPDTPAKRAGLLEGDLIMKIDGLDVTGKSAVETSTLLRGREGTRVNIVVKRAGNELTFAIIREEIHYVNMSYKIIEGDVGYIALKGFETKGAEAFADAKAELISAGAKSLIVDIRDNPGGVISTAVGIAEEFIEQSDIIHLKHKGEIVETVKAKNKTIVKIPTVILVNENSASASEILAGALQDNKAAIIVGETTYGKGSAQLMGYTTGGQPFRISVNYFLTPNKGDIHGVGITPDYTVRNSLGEFGEEAMALYEMFAPFAENTKPAAGDVGLNVFAAQQRLAMLGFYTNLSAVMDEATVEAVKAFQREQGLYAYGVLDVTTMRKIDEVTRAYISNDSPEDLQLKKAVELLKP